MRYVADGAATVALGDGEAAAPEKLIGLFASRESVRAQQLAIKIEIALSGPTAAAGGVS